LPPLGEAATHDLAVGHPWEETASIEGKDMTTKKKREEGEVDAGTAEAAARGMGGRHGRAELSTGGQVRGWVHGGSEMEITGGS
jgi:hypothetical protein